MPNQTRRTPARRRMTRGARGTELSAMHRWFGVTLRAIRRRAAKAIVDVALGASQLRVFAVERKDRRVIESLQPIGPVVARQTRFAHRGAMIRDKLRVFAAVACDARGKQRG